ncbi:hypothetical protein HRbin12_01808 [bacterium HR12]|nr:hypothetical protein HRbin12_01808 [bacterium HR12]
MRTRRERGSAVVELALLLPVLFLVLLAVVQVGVIARDRLVLEEAEVRAAVLRAASALDPARLELDIVREGAQGDVVAVGVRYRVRVAGPIAGWLLPAEVALRATAAMRQEVG